MGAWKIDLRGLLLGGIKVFMLGLGVGVLVNGNLGTNFGKRRNRVIGSCNLGLDNFFVCYDV